MWLAPKVIVKIGFKVKLPSFSRLYLVLTHPIVQDSVFFFNSIVGLVSSTSAFKSLSLSLSLSGRSSHNVKLFERIEHSACR